ncbi:hypothetical protein PV433_01390 [Paenibacillus sp. GYB004]|uniref:hypothetical protein n=1 Tax=Paenibacillus sp. GYB004 TaxID=2994393 RepID=UPI002F966357
MNEYTEFIGIGVDTGIEEGAGNEEDTGIDKIAGFRRRHRHGIGINIAAGIESERSSLWPPIRTFAPNRGKRSCPGIWRMSMDLRTWTVRSRTGIRTTRGRLRSNQQTAAAGGGWCRPLRPNCARPQLGGDRRRMKAWPVLLPATRRPPASGGTADPHGLRSFASTVPRREADFFA